MTHAPLTPTEREREMKVQEALRDDMDTAAALRHLRQTVLWKTGRSSSSL